MRIIPAIDIMDGKCVRLTQGDFNRKTIYNNDPLEVAKTFEDHGIRYVHLVDLDGARSGSMVNEKVLERIATYTNLKIDFGGGVKTDKTIQRVFDCGAWQVTGGSVAVKQESLFLQWLERYGPDRIILGADVISDMVAIQGWSENSGIELLSYLERFLSQGVQYVVCTDISRDGLLQGCAVDLYKKILNNFPGIRLIASGGIGSVSDLDALSGLNIDGVIIGKALYENRISLKELRAYVD